MESHGLSPVTQQKEIETKQQPIKIPKLIHFIWAGGTFYMPELDMEVVRQWAKANPSCSIYFWIDKKTANEDIINYYKKNFGDFTVFDEDKEIQSTVTKDSAPIVLKDISVAGLRDEYVAYEIDKITPNYGASSDFLRYSILDEWGGVYVDSDVLPGKTPLSFIFEKEEKTNKHILYVDHYTQRPNTPDDKLKEFKIDTVGNDTFICTPNNSLMKNIAKAARERYKNSSDFITANHVQLAHSGKNIRAITIYRTGPFLIQEHLKTSIEIAGGMRTKDDVIIKRVRDGHIALSLPKKNTQHWLKVQLQQKPYQTALQTVKKTIAFEAKYLHILRLDDHIDDIIASSQEQDSKLTNSKILNDIQEDIDLSQVSYAQITGKYPDTIEFCRKKRCSTVFNLPLEVCQEAIFQQALLHRFIEIENKVTRYKQGIKDCNFSEKDILQSSLKTLHDGNKIALRKQANEGIQVIENFISCIHEFKDESIKKQVTHFLSDRLDKYVIYATVLNIGVEEHKKIDIEKISYLQKMMVELQPKSEEPSLHNSLET